jgi:hypothetical protein
MAAPRFLPESAYSVTLANLDMKKVYEEIYKIVASMGPGAAAALTMPLVPATQDGQPGITFKSGIIDNMGTGLVVAQSLNKPFEAGKSPGETLVAIAVDNRTALEQSIERIHAMYVGSRDPESKRELLGHTMYLMSLPGLPFFGGGMQQMQEAPAMAQQAAKLAVTVTDTHLIMGEEGAVEAAIRVIGGSGAVSVGSKEWYRRCGGAVPGVAGVVGYEDLGASMEILWWMVKQTGTAGVSPFSMMMGDAEMGKIVDFGLLPPFEEVKKYFGVSAGYGVSRADGFYFESKYLDNPGE